MCRCMMHLFGTHDHSSKLKLVLYANFHCETAMQMANSISVCIACIRTWPPKYTPSEKFAEKTLHAIKINNEFVCVKHIIVQR